MDERCLPWKGIGDPYSLGRVRVNGPWKLVANGFEVTCFRCCHSVIGELVKMINDRLSGWTYSA